MLRSGGFHESLRGHFEEQQHRVLHEGQSKVYTDLALTTAKTSALRTMKRCVTLIREAIAAFPVLML